jgi:hypothetical protein
MKYRSVKILLCVLILSTLFSFAAKHKSGKALTPVMWQDPGDIASRDLFYGPGSPDRAPREPFAFIKEDLNGTNPKFTVADGKGVKWKVKLGVEARPEIAASRLVWAAGYFTHEYYLVPRLQVRNMPRSLKRGQELVAQDGIMLNARLKRGEEDAPKVNTWNWGSNPFKHTREFNGLRIMMALLNNLDLKDANNGIYRDKTRDIYMVNDLGCSFSARVWPYNMKGNLSSYKKYPFIRKIAPKHVDVNIPTGPEVTDPLRLGWALARVSSRWFGRNIPRSDAAWLGGILAQLSPQQIQDAFRAAGFSSDEADGFINELLKRIDQLKQL